MCRTTSPSPRAALGSSQFTSGTLPGYNYAGPAIVDVGHTLSQRAETAYLLQLALWTLEGQYSVLNDPNQDLLNPYVNMAAAQFGGGLAGLTAAKAANNPGDYNVGVLNLNYVNLDGTVGATAQPVLVRLPLRPASIGDYVWEDSNTNGVQDATEPGLPGATVVLTDCSGNIVQDANGNIVAPYLTAANGFYTFTNLIPGQYKVTVTLPGGYVFTEQFQGGDDAKDSNVNTSTGVSDCRNLVAGQNDDTVDAGAHKPAPAAIGNYIWEDNNTNGVQDATEPGIAGATVVLTDCNGNAVVDRDGNPVLPIVTAANGFYKFDNLAPGNYRIDVTLPSGYTFTSRFQGGDAAKDSNVNVATGESDCRTLVAGQYDDTVDAGAYKPVVCSASVCGNVFADCDGSGDLSVKDVGLKTVLVKLFNASGVQVGSLNTDTNGSYCFNGLAAGSYKVVVTPPTGYKQTAASSGHYWKDSYGRRCWVENDGNAHCVDNGVECWRGKDGYVHWKDSYGRDCWRDSHNNYRCQTISYKTCNVTTYDNTLCVTVTNCQTKLDVNFAYTGTTPKLEVCVKGPSSVKCGQTVTYTCTVTNTGNVCFKGGTVCHTIGSCGSYGWHGTPCTFTTQCPPLSPGQSCVLTQKCTVNWYSGGRDYNCESKVTCTQAYGTSACGQSNWKTRCDY
ncbi:MAG: SdrD B-like domain-containing protein [Verrucomicrobiota bacterium]